MKISVFLALFCFVLAVGFSVAVTEIDLANMADEFVAEKLPGEEYVKESDEDLDEKDLRDNDMAIPRRENDMATDDEEVDEGPFDNDEDDEDDMEAVEKSADPQRRKLAAFVAVAAFPPVAAVAAFPLVTAVAAVAALAVEYAVNEDHISNGINNGWIKVLMNTPRLPFKYNGSLICFLDYSG
ncbi:uncharacterized protein LOC113664302, partial [Pocillopora damicornis]|uniref:uncharacterized protein LOC113664302 n=1 Tax=Pocillopora damicornis TaxID=46731 RepID=UPI000F5563FB